MMAPRVGRPQGPERIALWEAALAFDGQGQGATFVQLAQRAKVGLTVARFTCWAMVKAGQLRVSGYVGLPGVRRPVAVFRPVIAQAGSDADSAPLADIMGMWIGRP